MLATIVPSELRERQRTPQENKIVAQEMPIETQGPGVGPKDPPRERNGLPKASLGVQKYNKHMRKCLITHEKCNKHMRKYEKVACQAALECVLAPNRKSRVDMQ